METIPKGWNDNRKGYNTVSNPKGIKRL